MKIKNYTLRVKNDRGFTLFVAMVITATLLLVSTGIIVVASKETFLTTAARDSQFAFYAADTGAELAIYWDVKNPSAGTSAFATSSNQSIFCNQDGANLTNPANLVHGNPTTTFTLTFLPDPYCADVSVTKNDDGSTKIEALGYNSCDTANPRRVERAVRVSY